MEPLLFLLALTFIGLRTAHAFHVLERRRRWLRQLREATREAAGWLGLQVSKADLPAGVRAAGRVAGLPLRIESAYVMGNREACTRLEVHAAEFPTGLSVRTEGILGRVAGALGHADVQTGDAAFDARFHLAGDEASVVALLDEETRRRLLGMAPDEVDFAAGKGTLLVAGRVPEPEWLAERARDLAAVAQRLSLAGRSVPVLLCENALRDANPEVRRRNLELLLRHHANAPETRAACTGTLAQAEGEDGLRLAAAHLGDAAWPLLEERFAAGTGSASLRLALLEHLIAVLPRPRLVVVLERALATGDPALWGTAARALGRLRHVPAFPRIVAELARGDLRTSTAAAEALGLYGDAAAEPALVGCLDGWNAATLTAAADALARVGSVAAVEALLACAEECAGRGASQAAARLRLAVTAIQRRLGAVETGGLSLAGPPGQEGGLSVADEGGGLSLFEGGRALRDTSGLAPIEDGESAPPTSRRADPDRDRRR